MASSEMTNNAPCYFKIDSPSFYTLKERIKSIGFNFSRLEDLVGPDHENVKYAGICHTEATKILEKAELITVDITPTPSECSETRFTETIRASPADPESADIYKNNFLMSTGVKKIIIDITEEVRNRTDIGSATMFKTIQLSNQSDFEQLVDIIKENISKDPEYMVDFEVKAKDAIAEYFVQQIHSSMRGVAKRISGV